MTVSNDPEPTPEETPPQEPEPQPLPLPPPPAPAPAPQPPSRFTPQRLLIFFGILVGVSCLYLVGSELAYVLWLRITAQRLVDYAINAKVDRIENLQLNPAGELVLSGARVVTQHHDGPKLLYTARKMRFKMEGDMQKLIDRGFSAFKELRLRRVDLDDPHLFIVKDMEGRWNLDIAFGRDEAEEGEEGGANAPDYFPREGIHIHDGTLHWVFYSEKGEELDWVIEDVSFKITKTPSGQLTIQNPQGGQVLAGSFYGGKVTAVIDLMDWRSIVEGSLQVKILDAQIARLTRNVELQRRMAGRLSGFLSLTRLQDETEGMVRGSGRFHVQEGDLYDYPMVVAALSVISFGGGSDNLITSAQAAFTLEEDHIRIEQLDFIGTQMSLYGSGECGLYGDDLYVVLSPKLPGSLNPLQIPLSFMGTALLEGSVVEPTARYTALASIEPSIRRLIEKTVAGD